MTSINNSLVIISKLLHKDKNQQFKVNSPSESLLKSIHIRLDQPSAEITLEVAMSPRSKAERAALDIK